MSRLLPAIAGAVACAAVFFFPVVLTGKTFIARDHYLFYNPRHFFVAETVRGGDLPLWNPYLACGVPAQANVQSAVFYPPGILMYLLPFQTGYAVYVVLHYILAAVFMFALMRSWSASAAEAGLAGMVYAFGGYCASINDNVAFLASAAWAPVVLLFNERSLRHKSLGAALGAAAVIALQILAGDASFYLLSTCLITLLAAVRSIAAAQPPRAAEAFRTLLRWSGAWTGGMLLAAVQLLPFLEYARLSHRAGGLAFAQASKWSLHPAELLQLLVPYPFGSIVPGTRWFGQQWLDTVYIGIFPLLCGLLFLRSRRSTMKGFLSALLVVGVLLGIGRYTPCYHALFQLLPGFAMLQYPVKFFFLAHFALSAMAGFGLESLRAILDRPAAARRLVTVGAGCAAAALLCALTRWLSGEAGYRYFLTFYPQNDYLLPIARSAWNDTGRALFSLTGLLVLFCAFAAAAARRLIRGPVAAAIFFCIVFVDLAALGKPADPCLPHAALARPTGTGAFLKQDPSLFRIYSFGPAQTQRSFLHVYALPFDRVYRMIRETLQENTNIYEGIHSAGEYSDLLLTRYYEIFAPAEQCLREARPDPAAAASGAAILSLLNVKYIVSPFALDAFPFRRVRSGPVNVYENPAVMPRAFATHRVTVLNSDEDVLERMRRSDYRPSETVYLTAGECARAPAACALGADNASEATVTIRDYRPGTVTMSAITGKPAMLVLADTYYPGWKAFVDGKERPVLRVNHTLRGVALEPGGHTVVFVFQPASLVWGAWLSLGASLVCGAAFVFSRRRRAFV